jgi:hypothetical protein
VNGPLLVAGALSLAGAAIHGIAGERLVLRKIALEALPAGPLGGAGSSLMMLRASWHFVTLTFFASGLALLYVGQGATVFAPGIVRFLGVLYSGFALMALAGAARRWRFLFRHPAPLLLSAIAVLIWSGG